MMWIHLPFWLTLLLQAAKKKAAVPTQKEEQPKVEDKPEPVPDTATAPTPAAAKVDSGKKPKKGALAALQKQIEERQRLEAEQTKLAEEEKRAREEEEKLEEERLKKENEAKARKKEKEKEKKQALKEQGLLLTKAQKEAKAKAEARKQQMLASGVKVAGLDDPREKTKPVYHEKKKKGPNKRAEEETRLLEAQKAAEAEAERLAAEREKLRIEQVKAEEASKADEAAESSEEDDWEAAADREVKDSWDADSDEEEHKPNGHSKIQSTAKSSQTGLPSRSATTTQKTDVSESESENSEDETRLVTQKATNKKKLDAVARKAKQHEEAMAARSKDNLRSPICCILGMRPYL